VGADDRNVQQAVVGSRVADDLDTALDASEVGHQHAAGPPAPHRHVVDGER
jgi:hypothetical protein